MYVLSTLEQFCQQLERALQAELQVRLAGFTRQFQLRVAKHFAQRLTQRTNSEELLRLLTVTLKRFLRRHLCELLYWWERSFTEELPRLEIRREGWVIGLVMTDKGVLVSTVFKDQRKAGQLSAIHWDF